MAVVAITMLYLLLSNLQMHSQTFRNRRELQHLLDLELPRKLRISEELTSKLENAEEASSVEEEDEFAGSREINENGGWDVDDPLEHLSMDYTSVKRRRPIHNMSSQHP